MNRIHRRLNKIEKQLDVGQKYRIINIAGIEITMNELIEVLNEIDGKSRGLPGLQEINESKGY